MNTNQHPNGFMYESRIAELESKVAALEKDNDDIHELAEHYRVENARLRESKGGKKYMSVAISEKREKAESKPAAKPAFEPDESIPF